MPEAYLRDMTDTDRALSRQLAELLELVRLYGPEPVADAIEKASAAHAFGSDYVANMLRQQQSPRQTQYHALLVEVPGHFSLPRRKAIEAGDRTFGPRRPTAGSDF